MRCGRVRDIFVAAIEEAALKYEEVARVMEEICGSPPADVADVRGAIKLMRTCAEDIDGATADRIAEFFREAGWPDAAGPDAETPPRVVRMADWIEERTPDGPEGAA